VIADIRNHATRFIQQVDFINAQCCTDLSLFISGCVFGVFGKDTADSPFVDAYIVCYTGKGMSERLLSKIEYQTFGHGMVLIHIGQFLKERLGAFSAFVTVADDQDTYSLSSDWSVHKTLCFRTVSIQQGAGTMWAARSNCLLFSSDEIVVCVLRNVQNAPMRPAKNIQEVSSMIQVLAHEFFLRRTITVKGGKRVLIHSTRYAELWSVCIVVLFYAICRKANIYWYIMRKHKRKEIEQCIVLAAVGALYHRAKLVTSLAAAFTCQCVEHVQ
jgi:hypothetical protein